MKRNDNFLTGMKEICSYLGRSRAVVYKWKQKYEDFPVKRIDGVWESDKKLLDKWREQLIEE